MALHRGHLAWIAAVACCALSACGFTKELATDELGHAGGAPGRAADYAMPAATKQMELFRIATLYAMLSQAGEQNIRDPNEEVLFLNKMQDTNIVINRAAKAIQYGDCNNPNFKSSDDCAQLFESYLPDIEANLLDMARLSMPDDDFKKLKSAIITGNIFQGAITVSHLAGKLIVTFHYAASTGRASVEVVMAYDKDAAEKLKAGTFERAVNAFTDARKGDALGELTPNSASITNMYSIALRSCEKIVQRLPDNKFDALGKFSSRRYLTDRNLVTPKNLAERKDTENYKSCNIEDAPLFGFEKAS